MSTRGIIARAQSDCWIGVFHHWDSNPCALGQSLFKVHHEHFASDTKAMMCVLIDEHPAGWDSIVQKDFSLTPGYSDTSDYPSDGSEEHFRAYMMSERQQRPQCRCHGDVHCAADTIRDNDKELWWCEWAYVIDERGQQMSVLLPEYDDKTDLTRWRILASFYLLGDEPDWAAIEKLAEREAIMEESA